MVVLSLWVRLQSNVGRMFAFIFPSVEQHQAGPVKFMKRMEMSMNMRWEYNTKQDKQANHAECVDGYGTFSEEERREERSMVMKKRETVRPRFFYLSQQTTPSTYSMDPS